MHYLRRIVETELDECLAAAGAVVLEGARNLRRLAQRAPRAMRDTPCEPSALAVIVPSGYGHAGTNDVGVIPIGALGP